MALKKFQSDFLSVFRTCYLKWRWWYFCFIESRIGKPKSLGEIGEFHARIYLEQQGLQFICANWLCRGGEIDLIMRHTLENGDEFLVFVEVKTRKLNSSISAEESVNFHKQRHLIYAANKYLQSLNETPYCRFDIVSVDVNQHQRTEIKSWIQGAFEG